MFSVIQGIIIQLDKNQYKNKIWRKKWKHARHTNTIKTLFWKCTFRKWYKLDDLNSILHKCASYDHIHDYSTLCSQLRWHCNIPKPDYKTVHPIHGLCHYFLFWVIDQQTFFKKDKCILHTLIFTKVCVKGYQ